jgi:hypothetical protein
MKYMVLQPVSEIQPDGSGTYNITYFDNKEEAIKFFEAALSVSSPGYAKKIRYIEYKKEVKL